MQQLEPMKDFFNRRSEAYDVRHIEGIDGGIESKRVLARFLPQDTKTLLDIGIGTGLELEEIFVRFPDMEVTGIDIADKMLEKLKEKYPHKNIALEKISYFDFAYEKETFDAAMSVMTLHHYTHEIKVALYRRIWECIKPGGIYLESDYMIAGLEPDLAQRQEDFFFAEYERLKAEQGLSRETEYHYDTPCTVENQKMLLIAAGFSTVDAVWRVENTVVLAAKK